MSRLQELSGILLRLATLEYAYLQINIPQRVYHFILNLCMIGVSIVEDQWWLITYVPGRVQIKSKQVLAITTKK